MQSYELQNAELCGQIMFYKVEADPCVWADTLSRASRVPGFAVSSLIFTQHFAFRHEL